VCVSDDHAGAIYRVARGAKGAGTGTRAAPAGVPGSGAATAAVGPAGAGSVQRGKALWARHDCALCHDPARATPGMVTRPLAGLSRKYSAQSLATYLAAPNPPMPAFDLSASDRADLAAFLLATHP